MFPEEEVVKSPRDIQKSLSLLGHRKLSVSALVICLAVGLFLLSSNPIFALWLPWAKEEDQVKATITEMLRAIAMRDKKMLAQYIEGPGADSFISSELEEAAKLRVKDYKCTFFTVAVDSVNQSWAWASYQKIAVLADGQQLPSVSVSKLKKVNGLWRVTVGSQPADRRTNANKTFESVSPAADSTAAKSEAKPGRKSWDAGGVTVEVSE